MCALTFALPGPTKQQQMDDEDKRSFAVVLNDEEQYSIWPQDAELPPGWRAEGTNGTKAECLEHIGRVWVDIRPLSLRRKIAEWEAARAAALADAEKEVVPQEQESDPVDDLVRRLGEEQPIEVSLRPEPTVQRVREAFDRGRVYVRFSRTGTELGIPVDRAASDASGCDFTVGRGVLRLAGRIVLNYNRVEFQGQIDLGKMTGTGALRFVEAVSPAELFAR